jgi:hypothetical protein
MVTITVTNWVKTMKDQRFRIVFLGHDDEEWGDFDGHLFGIVPPDSVYREQTVLLRDHCLPACWGFLWE